MKNESHLIEEWLEHQFAIGVEKVFLIDNGSTDDTLTKVESWVKDGRLELVSFTEQHQQERHYWNAFIRFRIGERFEWLIIADIDEFWFCKSGESIGHYLARQTDCDAIYTNWTVFGSNGHVAQPKSVRLSLIENDPALDRHTKCIFRTSLPLRENDIEVHNIRNARPWRVKVANRELQLNHYVTKSRDFWFKVKLKRGDAYFDAQDMTELTERFYRTDARCTAVCTRLRDMVKAGFR